MRKSSVWLLTIAGLVGLVMALGFERPAGPQGWVFRMGFPDTLAEAEWTSNSYTGRVYFLRWSFAILVASVYALCFAVRLSRRTPPQKSAKPGAAPERGGRFQG